MVEPTPFTPTPVTRSGADSRVIEISVSVPVNVGARITLEITPVGSSTTREVVTVVPDGTRLSGILAVTSTGSLARNVGADEARQALAALEALDAHILDIAPGIDVNAAVAATRSELTSGSYRGVLLVGGF